MSLNDSVALITGASRGLGRAIALGLAQAGAATVLAARDGQALNEVATAIEQRGGRALVVRCDVRDPAAVDALVQRALGEWGRIDVLVNSAGIALRRPAVELDLADWQAMLDTLLTGTFLSCHANI